MIDSNIYDGGRHERRLNKIKKLEEMNIEEGIKYDNNI